VSTVGLFAIGVVVTLIVGAALGLLVYGVILDGRYAAEHNADSEHNADEAPRQPPRIVAGQRPAA
jgi:hypothetical protein